MTTTLAIIGGIIVVLGAAAKIPYTVSALIRACIPMVQAFHDLRRVMQQVSSDAGNGKDS
jgi:hypothetical protein